MIHSTARRRIIAACLAASFAAMAGASSAQSEWPNKPMRLVVPFAAGLSIDAVARMIAEPLGKALGQPVVVDNKPGAAGIIGTNDVAKSPADGYTLLLSVTSVMSMNPHLYPKQPYDVLRDFAPVIQTSNVPFVLVTGPNQPYRSLKELITAAKAKPASIDYGSLGVGSAAHILTEMLNTMAGVRTVHIPYKGAFLADVMGGQIQIAFEPTTTAVPLIRSGKLKALGISSKGRNAAVPEVPAISEVVPGYEGDSWHGIFVPTGTPAAVVARVNTEVARIMRMPDIQRRLLDLGLTPVGNTREEFDAVVKHDLDKWGAIIKKNNIIVD